MGEKDMTTILGIQEAHDASAALMIDGVVAGAAQEERFTGLKGDYGYPEKAIRALLDRASVEPREIDLVALASRNWNPVLTKIKRNANFSVADWVKEQQDYWWPRLYEGRQVRYYDLFRDRPDFSYDTTYPMDHLLSGYMDPKEMEGMARIRQETVAGKLGLPGDRIRFVTHEDCHTFYAYFGSPLRGKALVLTSEGIGDYSNGTVSLFTEEGRQEIARTSENHLGHIYQYITLLLGMKPAQHEYKVMGLAPYANVKELERSYRVFRPILKVQDLNIQYDRKPPDLYFHFRKELEGHRFDGIAGGLQRFLDEVLCEWVENCVRKTGLSRVGFAGGVAQNIKACKAIGELDCVDEIHVCQATGDASLSIGACYYLMWERLRVSGKSVESIRPLETMFLGPEYTETQVSAFIQEKGLRGRYRVGEGVTPGEIAGLLAEGKILARCCGRMEFGLRALGNRSILADPRRPETVRKINEAIKFRDFWMPFTPTILAEREKDYLVNPKNLRCPHMTLAFDSTPLAQRDLVAALHPGDLTVRPQILRREDNPPYYAIIRAFEEKTGVGGILNTSFNLHGDPIVLGPEEALYTLENSALDGLVLGEFLVLR
jgi:carbamoyltransferase